MRSRLRLGFTGRSFLLVILAVIPALAIQGYNEYELRKASEASIRQRVIQITKQFGAEIGELREGARQLLLAAGQLEPVKLHQPQQCDALLHQLEDRFDNYSLMGAADAKGEVFCSSRPTSQHSIADTVFFKRAIAKDGLAVGNYWVDSTTGQKMIRFAARFQGPDGQVGGVVFAGLDLDWLSKHLAERGLSPTASILIADRVGNIIARLPHPEVLVGKNMRKSHERIMDGNTAGWEEAKGVDGVTRIFGYVPPALPPYDFFLSAGQEKDEAFASIDAATRRGLALIFAGLLAAMLAAWAGGRKFIRRPIESLLAVTGEWRRGNLDARVDLKDRGSEIGRLGFAFNEMADALAARYRAQQRAEEQLRHLNATLESRIERRTVELEDANRAKSQFLANMSHEIRTPLNGILGMLELARQTELAPTQLRFVDAARRSAESLLEIISGVLDLSKIEAGKFDLERRPFDLRSLVTDTAGMFAELAQGKGLQLIRSLPDDLPVAVIGDPARLRQILVNLIGNAIKFTQQGTIKIAAEVIGRDTETVFLSFTIADTGIGIPKERLPHVFDAFAQADGSTTRRYGGTGLGLTIAKQLCEMMGGSISVTSNPGAGSSFRFSVRLGLHRQPKGIPFIGSRPLGGLPVLIVDGVRDRVQLEDLLHAWDLDVAYVDDGDSALAAIRSASTRGERFGLVIVDLGTPGMSAGALVHAIRADAANAGLPLILLAAPDDDVGDITGEVTACLAKPVKQSALWDCLIAIGAELPESARWPTAVLRQQVPGIAGTRVLLVEDSPVNLEVGIGLLEILGCVVETATNGREALDRHAAGEFALIFLDCQMPEMDGFDTATEIRRREAATGRHTPIIALTANAISGDRERCLAAGMDDYVTKPFTPDQIRAVLVRWLDPAARTRSEGEAGATMPSSDPPAPAPIDTGALDELRQLQREGQPDVVQRVIELFLNTSPRLLNELEEAAATGDAELLRRASHTLKSSSANVGAMVLSKCCARLEQEAHSGKLAEASESVREIMAEYRKVDAALQALLPKVQ